MELFWFNKRKLKILEYTCQIKRLDSFNLTPFFMKIDVEGHELQVLRGGKETIRKATPIILIESVSDEHINFLKPFGYKLYKYDAKNKKFLPNEKGAMNSFMITDEKLKLMKHI